MAASVPIISHMYIDFSALFHQSSKDATAQGTHFIPHDPSAWPKEWKTVHYKRYEGKKISLNDVSDLIADRDLLDVIRSRASERNFAKRPITMDNLSPILKYSCGITYENSDRRRRAQPSGGGRYPIEMYPVIFRGTTELPSGVYHYDVKHHELDVISQRMFPENTLQRLMYEPCALNASCIIIMTAVFARNQNKYKERGYRHILLEAGHIGQNLYLVCNSLGWKCCSVSGIHDAGFEELIGIDGVTESVIYGLLVG